VVVEVQEPVFDERHVGNEPLLPVQAQRFDWHVDSKLQPVTPDVEKASALGAVHVCAAAIDAATRKSRQAETVRIGKATSINQTTNTPYRVAPPILPYQRQNPKRGLRRHRLRKSFSSRSSACANVLLRGFLSVSSTILLLGCLSLARLALTRFLGPLPTHVNDDERGDELTLLEVHNMHTEGGGQRFSFYAISATMAANAAAAHTPAAPIAEDAGGAVAPGARVWPGAAVSAVTCRVVREPVPPADV